MLTQSQESYREVLQVAENLYRQSPDWVTFFREVLGIDGIARKRFPNIEELTKFEQSEEFDKIQKMLVKLREKRSSADSENEPTRVITVRLPKSMHEYLRTEAHDLRTSMNKLCISKLLQVIGEEMIPNERSGSASKNAAAQKKQELNHADRQQADGKLPQPAFQSSPTTNHQHSMPFKPAQPRF